jgi:hypothetical protein
MSFIHGGTMNIQRFSEPASIADEARRRRKRLILAGLGLDALILIAIIATLILRHR